MAVAEARVGAPVVREGIAPKLLRVAGKAPVHLVLVVIGLLWLVPTFGLLLTSLLSPADIGAGGWWQLFSKPSLTTLEIAVGGTVLPIMIAALAGYAFAWLDFPGRDWLFIVVIGLLVVPLQMALIPIFSLYNDIGLFDTVVGLILFHTAFGLPFAIFLLRNFFVGIPKE